MAGQNDPAKVLGIWGPKGPISVMEVGSTMQLHLHAEEVFSL